MNEITDLMLSFGVKALGLLVLAFAIALGMRKASSAHRHAVWLVALMSVLLVPLVWLKAPSVEVPIPSQPAVSNVQVATPPAPTSIIKVPDTATSAQYQQIVDSATPINWPLYLGICWATVSLFLLLRLASGLNSVRRLVKRARPYEGDIASSASARINIKRKVRFLVTDGLSVPATAGTFKPVVFIPATALEWSDERLHMALTHELAHIKRLDWAWQVVAQLACAVHPLNPLSWFAASRLREESELACDDLVLAQGYSPDQYAAELLDIAKGARLRMAMVIGMVRKPNVEARLRSIVSGKVSRKQVTGRALVGALALAILIALPLAGLHAVAAGQADSMDKLMAEGYGQVVDPSGHPVAGATVIAVFRDDYFGRNTTKRQTDANGKFDFRGVKFPGMRLSGIIAQGSGYGLGLTTPFNRVAPLQIELSAPSQVKVQVLATDGSPIVGVPVQPKFIVRQNGSQNEFVDLPATIGSHFEAVTDSSGIATVNGMPTGCQANFGVNDPRYCSTDGTDNVDLGAHKAENMVVIKLHRASTIEGTVTVNGKPIANCKIMAQSQSQSTHSGWGEAVSGPDGHYRIERLRLGSYNLFIDGVGDLVGRAQEGIAVKEGEKRSGVQVELEKGAFIEGKVTDLSGRPVAQTYVGVYGPARPESSAAVQSALTDGSGHYKLAVPAGAQDVYPMDGIQDHRDVEVAAGETAVVNFKVAGMGPAAIRGTVLDSAGRPAANANVEILPDNSNVMDPQSGSGRTNADGKFMVVLQRVTYPLSVRVIRGKDGVRAVVAKETRDIRVQLMDNVLVSASGRVIDGAGKPVANVNLNLYTMSHDRSASQIFAKSDADGKFTFDGVWPTETVGLGLNMPGYESVVEGPKVFPHGNTDLGVIKLLKLGLPGGGPTSR